MVPQKWTNTHTDTHTHTHMDESTYRKHRPRGPMLWKYKCILILFFGPIQIQIRLQKINGYEYKCKYSDWYTNTNIIHTHNKAQQSVPNSLWQFFLITWDIQNCYKGHTIFSSSSLNPFIFRTKGQNNRNPGKFQPFPVISCHFQPCKAISSQFIISSLKNFIISAS